MPEPTVLARVLEERDKAHAQDLEERDNRIKALEVRIRELERENEVLKRENEAPKRLTTLIESLSTIEDRMVALLERSKPQEVE